jgi:hypothetical protein
VNVIEEEWQEATDPERMLNILKKNASNRKLILLMCGYAKRVVQFVPETVREVGEYVEKYADGLVPDDEEVHEKHDSLMRAAVNDPAPHATYAVVDSLRQGCFDMIGQALWIGECVEWGVMEGKGLESYHTAAVKIEEATIQASLVRDIFGNPFRPVALDPRWQTETVVLLAQGIYADKAFDRIPILADALEDAGCDNADILNHCRGEGPHVRGCWVVDLVLGKS